MDTKQLRVAFLVDAIQGRNGVGTYHMDLVEQLQGRVAHAALFAPSLDVPTVYQGLSIPMPGDATQRLFLPHFRRLYRRLREIRPHVIVVPAPGPYGLMGFAYARLFQVPLCVCFQTDLEKLAELYWHPLVAQPSMGFMRFLNNLMFHAGDAVVTISDAMMDKARAAGIANARLVGTPLGDAFVSRPVQPLDPALRRALFVGRLAPEKNLETYVQAAEALPEVAFQIAGDGPLRNYVEERAAVLPNLTYLGWQTREGVVDALDAVDVLVLPSKVEAFGTVVLEAMARRRLVVTSSACGINDWPELAAGIHSMAPGEGLVDALKRIRLQTSAERDAKAELAMMASHGANEQVLDAWLAVFSDLSKRKFAAQLAPEPLLNSAAAAEQSV